MKKDKLKSTTVRFTESDLHFIAFLQDKLGLGMIQVIRLAIRRLAEIENILTSPPRKKSKN
jgi:hypothetical protein